MFQSKNVEGLMSLMNLVDGILESEVHSPNLQYWILASTKLCLDMINLLDSVNNVQYLFLPFFVPLCTILFK